MMVALLLWAVTGGIAGFGVANAQGPASPPYISPPVTPLQVEVIPPPPATESAIPDPRTPMVTVPEGEPLPTKPPPPRNPIPDPMIQTEALGVSEAPIEAIGLISDPIVNVAGLTSAANPPDTVGDIGREHFVQMVNATFFQIFDKQGNALTGAMNFGALWPIGQICRSNAGDPIVVYDHLADRWLLSQFADPNHMCVAISQTPDPTAGTWFLYTFNTLIFPDYPKFGVWPNGYYMSSYEFPNLGIYVFDRTNMLLGFAAGFFKTTIPALGAPGVRDTRILPADLDGPAPAGGRPPNFFVRTVDGQQDPANPTDRIQVYELLPDFVRLTFSFTLVNTLFPAPFQTMLCNRSGQGAANPNAVRDCIPQPNTVQNVDALSNRPMMQLKYRNFGAFEAMVFNQTIDVSGSIPFVLGFTSAEEVAGVRWYELRKSGANWAIHQQGTFAPQPLGATAENQLLHRWMGSAAIDKDGNIALGYSISNDDDNNPVFPSIRYTGRRFDDPLDLMPQGEKIILNGTNSLLGTNSTIMNDGRYRWGDYSALSVDPVDDCTFWYTTHVAPTSGAGARPTRIGSFSFDTCGGVIVHVGYLDNQHGTLNPARTPKPFDSDANTILISTGGVATSHDTGVIRFENRTKASVTIDPGLQVTTEQAVFQLWDSFLPITLAAGQNLVLAETENFNFDTSDFGLAIDPVVSGSVNGLAFSFTDHARVLLGREESGTMVPASNETTPYQELGRIAVQVTANAMK